MNNNGTWYKSLTEDDIVHKLAAAPDQPVENPYPTGILNSQMRPAAVLVPFLQIKGEWHVLYIRRTVNQSDRHSGQVAFPGGGADPQDRDILTTALREAQEEIGLHPQDVKILGRLRDFYTISSYQVTPIVARIPWPYPLSLQTQEVSRAFTIPLSWLADPKHYEVKKRLLPAPFRSIDVIYFQPYQGETLWGATARFTLNLLEVLANTQYQNAYHGLV